MLGKEIQRKSSGFNSVDMDFDVYVVEMDVVMFKTLPNSNTSFQFVSL